MIDDQYTNPGVWEGQATKVDSSDLRKGTYTSILAENVIKMGRINEANEVGKQGFADGKFICRMTAPVMSQPTHASQVGTRYPNAVCSSLACVQPSRMALRAKLAATRNSAPAHLEVCPRHAGTQFPDKSGREIPAARGPPSPMDPVAAEDVYISGHGASLEVRIRPTIRP